MHAVASVHAGHRGTHLDAEPTDERGGRAFEHGDRAAQRPSRGSHLQPDEAGADDRDPCRAAGDAVAQIDGVGQRAQLDHAGEQRLVGQPPR